MIPLSANKSGFECPIFIAYREPFWLDIFRISIPAGAITAVLYTAINWPVKLTLVICILIYSIPRSFSRDSRSKRNSTVIIVLNQHDQWRIIHGEGEEATLLYASVASTNIIFLRLISRSKKCFNLLITPHCLDQVSMRRLRVRLRYSLKYAKEGVEPVQ